MKTRLKPVSRIGENAGKKTYCEKHNRSMSGKDMSIPIYFP